MLIDDQEEHRSLGHVPLNFVSCGKPVLNNEVMIVSHEGIILEERHMGEVIVRGHSVMDGYFKKESETKKTIRNRWLYSGVLGYLADGELYITGRKKDLIIKGGRNYCPQDIEAAAELVDGVRKGGALAIGVYDEKTATDKVIILLEAKPSHMTKKKELTTNIVRQVSSEVGMMPDEVHIFPLVAL